MNKEYYYHTNCVQSTAELIDDMQEKAKDVSYNTLLKHCDGLLDWAEAMYYVIRGDGLKLKDDWAVSFKKSIYDGMPCYYVEHSRIEHIWVKYN